MKKLFLLCFLFMFSLGVYSQKNEIYLGVEYSAAFKYNDDVLKLIPSYSITEVDSQSKSTRVIFTLRDSANKPLKIRYSNNQKDGDPVLGIADKMLVDKINITGNFLDLFKIYQSFYSYSSDLNEVKSKGATYVFIDTYRVFMQRYDINTGVWNLTIEKK